MQKDQFDIPSLISIIDASKLGWFGVIFTIISIIISIYMVFIKTTWSWTRLKSDYNYQLKCAVVLLLLINRVMHLVYLLTYYKSIIYWNLLGDLGSAGRFEDGSISAEQHIHLHKEKEYYGIVCDHLIVVIYISVMLMLGCLLFLTMDRYQRVAMILRHSKGFYVFLCVKILVVFTSLYNAITFTLIYSAKHLGFTWKPQDALVLDVYYYFKIGSFVFWYIWYYILTVRLIAMSIATGNTASQSFFKQLYHFYASRDARNSKEFSSDDGRVLQVKRLHAGLKMMGLFLLLTVVDAGLFTVMVATALGFTGLSYFENVALISFAAFWIVVHVGCVFQLLDMFVRDLIRANNREKSSGQGFFRRFKRLTAASTMEESQVTDVVDLSLMSEYKTTALLKTTHQSFLPMKRVPKEADTTCHSSFPSILG